MSTTIVAGVIAPSRPGFFRNGVTQDTRTSVSSAPITASQTLTTVTSSAPFFSPADVGKILRWDTSEVAKVTAFISNTQVTASPSQSVASGTFKTQGHTLGGNFGRVAAANSSGVLGVEESTVGDADIHFVWYNLVSGEYRDLGSSQNGSIQDTDEAGFLLLDTNPGFSGHHAILYNPSNNSFTDQGLPAGGPGDADHQASPIQMNASHVVAVSGSLFSQPRAYRGFGGSLTDIHPADADSGGPNPGESFAIGINSGGDVVGYYININTDGIPHAFLNTGGSSFTITGFPGESDPLAINDSGTVIGTADDGLGAFRAFYWSQAHGVNFIPQISGTTNGEARSINSDGWITGDMDGNAFLFADNATVKLLDVMSALDPGWTAVFTAAFVNNQKQISGFGIYNGNSKAYLLTLV